MALEAWLSFTTAQGQTTDKLKILECDFEFRQDIDKTGKPSSKPYGGLIHITVESTEKATIAEWMFSTMGLKDGHIEFPLRQGKKKDLNFEDGVCIAYQESFNASDSTPMLIRFTISANRIIVNTATYSNDWKNIPK